MKKIIAQIDLVVGDINANAELIIKTAQNGVVTIFPEMAITGYPAEDLWLKNGFIQKEQAALEYIAANAKSPVILGATYTKDGKLFNGAYYINGGKAELVSLKKCLPNNGVFDENRYFSSDGFFKLIDGVGVVVCEDFWHEERINEFKQAGAKELIVINASPYEWGKLERRKALAQNYALPITYVNYISGQDEIIYDGNSFYYDGKNFFAAPAFEEFIGEITQAPKELSKEESNYKAMVLGVRDYVRKNGFSKVLLGVSGGIDSALVAAIAVDALGASNVRGVILPTKYSSKITMEDAYGVCKALGIPHEEHEVWDNYKREEGMVAENMQSRTRGLMLMALSNKHNELLLTTGNKSEIATGYCTIYGDMSGAYNPIKDLYKTEVWAVAKYFNSLGLGKIPQRVITKAPTAELKENQTDQDTLPPYEVLDAILYQMIEERKTVEEISGFDTGLVKKVARMVKLAEFKRKQAAVGVKLSRVAFGKDWRMPITNHSI